MDTSKLFGFIVLGDVLAMVDVDSIVNIKSKREGISIVETMVQLIRPGEDFSTIHDMPINLNG
jgi:hypothetical protein